MSGDTLGAPSEVPATPPGLVPRDDLKASLRAWLGSNREEPYFVVSGAVGSGKSTTLAWLLNTAIEDIGTSDLVAVAHFCLPQNLETRNPIAAAESLAEQLAGAIDPYAELLAASSADRPYSIVGVASAESVAGTLAGVLIQKLTINASVEDAWRRLIVDPLRRLYAGDFDRPLLLVLDGLDEADRFDGPVRLSDLVAGIPPPSPSVRYLLSTRTPDRLMEALGEGRTRRWDLSAGEGLFESGRVVAAFLDKSLRHLHAEGKIDKGRDIAEVVEEAADRSQNNFLYARFLTDTIALGSQPIGVGDVAELPRGLEQFWRAAMRAIVGADEESWLGRFAPLLEALCAAREPLHEPELEAFTGLTLGPLRFALEKMRPFVKPSQDDAASRPSHAFYHTGVLDFLTNPDLAGEWHCDARAAHRRIVHAYRERTDGWRESDWQRVDSYGLRHVITHALAGEEPPATLDAITTPGFFEAVNRQLVFGATDRQFKTLLRGAAASGDGIRALRWAWTLRQVQDHLSEQLSHGASPILIRAGRAAAAWGSLAALGSEEASARRSLVVALARDGQTEIATMVAAEAAPDVERQGLRLAVAAELAASDPAASVELVGTHDAGDDVLTRICATLARHPDYSEQAWEIAQRSARAQHAVVATAAQYAPKRAAEWARTVAVFHDRVNGDRQRRGTSSALGDVCVAAAASNPGLVADLIPELKREDCARAAFALALQGGREHEAAIETARQGFDSDALLLLVDAARVAACREESVSSSASVAELKQHLWNLHRYDVDVISRLELEHLRDSPPACEPGCVSRRRGL